ncbi:hypothetical protein LLG96_01565 [bacterium]|nr:hypothetical protein [bacterium]
MNGAVNISGNDTIKQTGKHRFSNALESWRFVVLSVISAGIYEFYWFYRNWKLLKNHRNPSISPGWRTAGLSVPVYNIVLLYRQFRDIRDSAREEGCAAFSSPGMIIFLYTAASILLILIALFEMKVKGTAVLAMLTFLSVLATAGSVWPLAVVQATYNRFWKNRQPDSPVRTSFSKGENILLVLGSLYWALTFLILALPK